MKKHRNSNAVYLILAFILSGCSIPLGYSQPTPTPIPTAIPVFDFGDGGLLSNEPCGPPCFWNIEPGKTTQVEASQILENLGVLENCLFFFAPDAHEGEASNTWSCPGEFGIGLRKDTGIVTSINFTLQESIELQKMIEKYGNPDLVWIFDTGFVDAPSASATVCFTKFGMQFLLPDLAASYYPISQTTLIKDVVYQDYQSMQRKLKQWSDSVTTWKGYGNYP